HRADPDPRRAGLALCGRRPAGRCGERLTMTDFPGEDLHPLKARPRNAQQHVTAGPYSPVLEVDARHLVVLSGQVAVDLKGGVAGGSIEEQTRVTLQNCADHLAAAGCSLADVFKVNIY